MKIYRNFMNPKFVKKNKFDKYAHEWSPAMYLGLSVKVMTFEEIFAVRKLRTQVELDQREENFLNRHYHYSRQKIAPK